VIGPVRELFDNEILEPAAGIDAGPALPRSLDEDLGIKFLRRQYFLDGAHLTFGHTRNSPGEFKFDFTMLLPVVRDLDRASVVDVDPEHPRRGVGSACRESHRKNQDHHPDQVSQESKSYHFHPFLALPTG